MKNLHWIDEPSKDIDRNSLIVVRDNGAGWDEIKSVWDRKGSIVAQIPYYNRQSKEWAIAIAKQIVSNVETRPEQFPKFAESQDAIAP